VHVWDATTGKTAFVFLRHGAAVQQARWSPDGAYLAVCSLGDRVVRVWYAKDRRLVYTYRGQPHGVQAIAWSPDSKYIASAGPDGMIAIWHATTGARVFSFMDPSGTAAAPPAVPGSVTPAAGRRSDLMPDGNAAPEELAASQTTAGTVLLDGTASGTKSVNWSTNSNYWSSGGGSGGGGGSGSVTVTATGSRSHG
jgi:WD40 repeat protein